MSARPGRIIAEREVTFPRPRDLEITYTPAFADVVHELRSQIKSARDPQTIDPQAIDPTSVGAAA
jgi:NitT/TauT family transport system ATP-binding protein